MRWQSVSFDWNQARAFLATVEEGSFSAAARALGVTQPTLGRQVAALESDLDIVLFERVGRSLVLTDSGRELLEHVKAMRDAATAVSLTASGRSQSVEGQVRITASDVMSAYILPTVLRQLRRQAPLLEIDIVSANDIRNLQQREADIAIRHVRSEQLDLIAKLVCETSAHFYASKDYLDRAGRPEKPSELSSHDIVGFGNNPRLIELMKPYGIQFTADNFRTGSESGIVAWEMARAGLGAIIMADRVARGFPEMELVVPDMEPMMFPIWLTAHRELHTSQRIRLVFDILDEFLKERMSI